MSSNDTVPDRPPPIIDPNNPPIEFFSPAVASAFRALNGLRPESEITVSGPEAVNYFVGLAIVPIVLVVFLLLWLLLLSILGCCQARLETKKKKFKRKSLWICVTLLVFGSLIAWVVALGYSIASLDDLTLSQSLNELSGVMASVTAQLEGSQENVTALQQTMTDAKANCPSSNSTVQSYLSALSDLVDRTATAVTDAASRVLPYTSQTATELHAASTTLWNFFYIRTIVFSVISGVQVALVLVCFVVAAMGWAGKIREIHWFNRGCCCRGCCTPLLFFAVFTTVLMIALAALLHAVALAFSDMCSPNVNTAINRIAGQLIDYPSFATFYGTNLTEMCGALDDYSPRPLIVLCFYQTCQPQTAYVTDGVQSLNDLFSAGQDARNKSAPLIEQIRATIPSTPCTDSLDKILPNYASVVYSTYEALYILSCNSLNQLYAQAVYDTLCSVGVPRAVGMFNAWISGSIILMIALAVWLVYRMQLHNYDEDSSASETIHHDEKRPATTANDDGKGPLKVVQTGDEISKRERPPSETESSLQHINVT